MRIRSLVIALFASSTLLVAGVAQAGLITELLVGPFTVVDKKNVATNSDIDVLVSNENSMDVFCECDDSSTLIEFVFSSVLIDQSKITTKKAQLQQKDKTNPPLLFAAVNLGEFELLACTGKGKLDGQVDSKGKGKFKADIKDCTIGSIEASAVDTVCKASNKAGNKNGPNVSAKGSDLKKVKCNGTGEIL
jgi:hypothetical protein